MSTNTPNPVGSLFRTRARVASEYNAAWRAAQVAEAEAVKAARLAFVRATEAAQARRDEDYPLVCVSCEGSTRPECDGCDLFVGVRS